jgi:hypothetical protein
MKKWMYVRTNGYDMIVRINGETARVLTQTEDFPNSNDPEAVEIFMSEVIDWDYSDGWDEFPAAEILEEINKRDEIVWQIEA